MSNPSARLGLPYLMPSQAQKHVTHNEALQRLDALSQLSVVAFGAETPPATPQDGAAYALGPGASGAWAGEAGKIAYYADGTWLFIAPGEGWRAWGEQAGELRVYQGGAWEPLPVELDNVDGVGVNTTADSVNRLAVASDASLLSHDGAGHQLKINKAADTDTASLLFQSAWTGHAEMGLAGNTDFAIKVSPDGSAWHEVFRGETDGYARAAFRRLEVNKGGTNQTGIASATPTKLSFGNVVDNPGGFFDAALSRYTPPAGVVLFNAGVYLTGLTAGGICTLRLTRNGSVMQQVIGYAAAGGDIGLGIDVQDAASGTDDYEVEVYVTTAGTGTANGNPVNTFFKALLL